MLHGPIKVLQVPEQVSSHVSNAKIYTSDTPKLHVQYIVTSLNLYVKLVTYNITQEIMVHPLTQINCCSFSKNLQGVIHGIRKQPFALLEKQASQMLRSAILRGDSHNGTSLACSASA